MVAAPWLYRWVSRVVLRNLPVDSPIRRALLVASFRSGYGAFNRRDYQLLLVRYTADCEFVTSSGLRSLGASDSIQSHDALRGFIETIAEAWQGWELIPQAFVDLGDRVLWLGIQRALGGSSQVPIEDPYAQLQHIERGLITRQLAFNDWNAALRSAGLRPGEVAGLEELRSHVH